MQNDKNLGLKEWLQELEKAKNLLHGYKKVIEDLSSQVKTKNSHVR